MSKFEIIAGTIPQTAKLSKHNGIDVITYTDKINRTFAYIELPGNILNITQITEENKSSFLGKAGWGIVGGLALGGIGALAGVLAGGNKKEVTIALEMKTGEKIMVTVDPVTLKFLYALSTAPKTVHGQFDTVKGYSAAEKNRLNSLSTEEQNKILERNGKINLVLVSILILALIFIIVYFFVL